MFEVLEDAEGVEEGMVPVAAVPLVDVRVVVPPLALQVEHEPVGMLVEEEVGLGGEEDERVGVLVEEEVGLGLGGEERRKMSLRLYWLSMSC